MTMATTSPLAEIERLLGQTDMARVNAWDDWRQKHHRRTSNAETIAFDTGWEAAIQHVRDTLPALLAERQSVEAAVGEERCLSPAEQVAQAGRCACRGIDDMCPCQNVPDRETIRQRTAP